MLKNYPYRDQDTGGGGGILPSDESLRNRLKEIQLAEDNLRLELETNKVYESRKDLKKQISSISGQIQDLLVEESFYEIASEATLRSKTELLQSQEKAQKALLELEIVKLSATGDALDILEMEEEMLKGTLGSLDAQISKRDEINEQIGLMDNLLLSIDKIPFLGEMNLGKDALKAMDEALVQGATQTQALGKAFGVL